MAHAYDGGASKYSIGLVIGVASRGPISIRWMMHQNKIFPGMLPPGIEWKYGYTVGKAVHTARQDIVEKALREKAKYVMFVDDDVFLPLNSMVKLVNHNKDVCMGLYWGKAEPCFPVIFEPDTEIGVGPWLDYPRESLTRVAGGGLGCCLIKTDVFRKLREEGEEEFFKIDWIRTKKDGQKSKVSVGEDHYFYELCEKHGIDIWCDTSIRCDHYDMVNDKFFPTEDIIEKENKLIDKADPKLAEKTTDSLAKQPKKEESKPLKQENNTNIPDKEEKQLYEAPEGLKLNLGCGNQYKEGYENLDKLEHLKTDKQVDLEDAKLPYEDNSVGEVLLHDVLEHISDPFPLMKEIWRVCKEGAIVDIMCPYPWSDYQACDPTHVKAYNEITFSFFTKEAYEKDKGTARSPIDLGFDYSIKNMILIPNQRYVGMSNEDLREAKSKYLNVIDRIRCILVAKKK